MSSEIPLSMQPPSVKRNRAVRLNSEVLKSLNEAIQEKWLELATGERLTRDRKADLLGVSAVTAQRILENKGVDRTTLCLAFNSLGLTWDDSLCEPNVRALPKPDPQAEIAAPPPLPINRSRKAGSSRVRFAGIASLLALAGIGVHTLNRKDVDSETPDLFLGRSLILLSSGTKKYNDGDIRGAHPLVLEAANISRRYRGPRELSEALKVLGDIEAALGNLESARDHYQQVLDLRALFVEDTRNGSVLEGLAVVKTRLGDLQGAKRDLEHSIKLFTANRDWPGVPIALRDLGTVAYLSGALDEADLRFREALAKLEGMAKPDIVTDIRARRALVTLKRGQVAPARTELRACLAYWRARNHPRWVATTQLQLAMAEMRAGNAAGACELRQLSLQGFEAIGDRAGVKEVTELQGEFPTLTNVKHS